MWANGIATDYKDLLLKIKNLASTDLLVSAADGSGNTGNGIVFGHGCTDLAVDAEIWTIEALTATTFSVDGDISGSQAGLTINEPYSNTHINLTVLDGSTPFVAGDTFTFSISDGNTPKWSVLRYASGTDDELILQGIGKRNNRRNRCRDSHSKLC